MHRFSIVLLACNFAASATIVLAQPPQPPPGGGRPGGGPPGFGNRAAATIDNPKSFIDRLLTLDANKDDKLAQSEVKDDRLQALFKQLDADGDGAATRQEMQAYYAKQSAAAKNAPRGGLGGGFGPGRRPPGGPNGTRPQPPPQK